LQVLVLTGKQVEPLLVFYVLHQVKQVLDRFPHLMGLRCPDFTIYEVGRAPIRGEPDSKQEDEYRHEGHRNLFL
jgi:hypothetical protein